MIEKMTTFSLLPREGIEMLDNELVKTASFILPDGVDYDPDYVYMIVRAVSAGEYWGPNKNLDYFPEKELLESYKTFLSAHTFKNHENKHVENAIGDVLKAEWNDTMKCVELVIRIDRRIAPTIARGFEKGFMTDVSMGCRISHSVCSICGNVAKNRTQFCEHIRSMKGKVFDDGKKVYEINVGPKFHDISAVLNGAEKCAKMLNLYVHNSKVAVKIDKTATFNNESMEKVASFNDFNCDNEIISIRKQADQAILDSPIFEKTASTKTLKERLAEAKEEVTSKVTDKAVEEVAKKGHQSLDKVSDIINLLYTDYWTKEKCTEIGNKIRVLSKDKGKSPEETFSQFLRVLDFAGIRISPLELGDIYTATTGGRTPDLRLLRTDSRSPEETIHDCNTLQTQMSSKHINLPSALKMVRSIDSDGDSGIMENPKAKLSGMTIIISKKSNPVTPFDMEDDLMNKIISPLMPSRSNHMKFLMPRLESIFNGDVNPSNDYNSHYMPLKVLDSSKKMEKHGGIASIIKSAMMHVANENDRVERLASGELEEGFKKFAHYIDDCCEIEKTAKTSTGVALATIPLTFSYSALQRSRMNNGENISSANRFVAENPSNAAFLVASGTKLGHKAFKKGKRKFSMKMGKVASEDIFENKDIDNAMLDRGYSKKELSLIKKACIINELDEDMAHSMIKKANIQDDAIGNYLQEASNCITIDIEKYANIRDIGRVAKDGVVADVLFRNNKGPLAAALPGYMVDGLALAGISKGVEKLFTGKENKSNV